MPNNPEKLVHQPSESITTGHFCSQCQRLFRDRRGLLLHNRRKHEACDDSNAIDTTTDLSASQPVVEEPAHSVPARNEKWKLQCQWCQKWFVNLDKHKKCRKKQEAVSLPDKILYDFQFLLRDNHSTSLALVEVYLQTP